jgi:hypothetical protein
MDAHSAFSDKIQYVRISFLTLLGQQTRLSRRLPAWLRERPALTKKERLRELDDVVRAARRQDHDKVYSALIAALHALRDWLPLEEAIFYGGMLSAIAAWPLLRRLARDRTSTNQEPPRILGAHP